jgi:hypothetical protein
MENVRVGQNENIDDDTRERAQKFVQSGTTRVFADPDRFSGPAAKTPIVTKEELAKSGMSLRDYMNAQQGRTRRGASAAPVDTSVERGLPAMSAKERSAAIDQIPLDDKRTPVKGESASGSELGRNVKNTLNAMAGFKGVQLGQAAVEGLATPRAVAAAKGLMGGKPAAEARRIEPTMTSAAEKAKLAGELRRGAQPTKFTSPSRSKANKDTRFREDAAGVEFRKGGSAKGYASGGAVSASRRGDGIAQRGKTRGKMC